MAGFAGVEGDAFPVSQEMSNAVFNVLKPGYGDHAGLTRAERDQRHPAWATRENGNRPFAVRGKFTGASFAQLHRGCTVDFANGK